MTTQLRTCFPLRAVQPVSLTSFRPVTLQQGPHTSWRAFGMPRAALVQPRRRNTTVAARASTGATELLLDPTEGPKLQSPSLDPEIRRRAEDAIIQRGYRVTIGDVAAVGSITLGQSEAALRALATDSLANLLVSDSGDIVYVFPKDFKSTIASKSLKLRLEPVAAGVAKGAAYIARVAFGTALITSVLTVSLALIAITSTSKDDNRRSNNSMFISPRMWFNLSDFLWFWDPYYSQRRAALRAAGGKEQMSFLESVFSFVFGDGDPNASYERRRWEALGRYIQSRGGVVTAEEMAPYLDITPEQVAEERRNGTIVDESFVLPALTRLGGDPEVDALGNIVYRFPSLQLTALAARTTPSASAAYEQRWQQTEASAGQRMAVFALGLANFVGIVVLSSQLSSPMNAVALIRNGLGWVLGSMPYLQVYAVSFFAIPAVRALLNTNRNRAIDARNEARQAALEAVRQPCPALATKLAAASQQAQRKVINDRDVVYRSDVALEDQPVDAELDAWEKRLFEKKRTSTLDDGSGRSGWDVPMRGNDQQQQQKDGRWR